MRCFRTYDLETVALTALGYIATAAFTALLPQYALFSFAFVTAYALIAFLLRPLCEWQKRYYAVAALGFAAIPIYVYALGRALKELPGVDADWIATQVMSIAFSALTSTLAYMLALSSLRPVQQSLPESRSFMEVLGAADDACNIDVSRLEHGELQRLICNGDLSAADSLPNYALIIAAYYAMFRRRDPGLAEKLLNILKGRNLSKDERDAINVLETAQKAMATCDVQLVCNMPAVGWAAFFKELVVLHFVDAKTEAAKRLKCRIVKASGWHRIYIYNTAWRIDYAPDPRLHFIYYATDRAQPLPTCQPQSQ